jgi:RNA polymerase sigma-70 factor (family 1)
MKSWSLNQLQKKIALERDELAYKELFFHFYPSLTRFAIGFVKLREAAEEVVSDVMLKIWTLEDKLDTIDNLTVYLYRAIRNRSLNYIRDNQKHIARSLDILDDAFQYPQPDPEEFFLQNEWKEQMRSAVAGLPPKCQMVYKLIRENGLTYREVAAVMNISENTVDRHLNNALHKMVKSVKAYAL